MSQVLVIGASGYIGKEIVKKLQSENHKVIGTYKNNCSHADINIELDISSLDSIANLENELKDVEKIDAIIFSQSYLEREILKQLNKGSQLSNLDDNLNQSFLNINTINVIKVISLIEEKLKNSTNPNIIFLGSLVGKKALNAPLFFSAAKGAINGLVESLSKELGASNIKVNSVDPGILKGGVSELVCEDDKKSYLSHCALRRFGEAREVANVCGWLATKNTFITGKPFVLDGAL